jgi:hypothetical protein
MKNGHCLLALLGLLASVLVSCGGDDKKETCAAGSENCTCLPADACDDGLECKAGLCVPVTSECPAGTQNCPCLEGELCEAGLQPALVCTEGLCVPEGTQVGGLNDPCGTDKPCGFHEGQRLECRDGSCQLPEAGCVAGTLGCPCDGGACSGSLECVSDACAPAAGSGLVVGVSDVRACDVLLELDGVQAVFSGKVLGVSSREGKKLALSFIARADETLGTVAALETLAGGKADLTGLTISSLACFDRLGKPVATPELSFK